MTAVATRISRLASRFPRTLEAADCAPLVERIMGARSDWTPNFGGVQFTLGRAWYTHLEEDLEDDYFDCAEESDALVEAVLPGFQDQLLDLASDLVGAPVHRRRGYCGPGIHVFPALSEVARRGGEPHFDTEGLTKAQLAIRAPALTLVLMLQPARIGGGLAVWDETYAGNDFPPLPPPSVACELVDYRVGEMVVIDSYRLHQIQPFEGTVDRVSATLHLVQEGESWLAWF